MRFPLTYRLDESEDGSGDPDTLARLERRVLVLAPSANDARITMEILQKSGLESTGCADLSELAEEVKRGCGTLIVAEEALTHGPAGLSRVLPSQPAWSSLPITIVTSASVLSQPALGAETSAEAALNITILERPFRPDTLVSSMKAALRARLRQYEVRDLLLRLHESEVRVRGILDSVSDAFMTVNASWQITYVNAAIRKLFAPLFAPDEIVTGRDLWEAFPDFQDTPIGTLYRRVMTEGHQQVLEIFYAPLQAWLEIRAFPSAYALSLYIRDITPRREAEQALRLAKEKAEALNQAKDRFLAVLSHELRTPLTPVLMISSARATDPAMPALVRDDMALIRRNVELETKLIDDLLDLSRITTNKLHLSFENVRVNDMIEQVCEICRSEIELQGLKLDLALSPGVDGIRADPSRFQQILWNIIKNATKFTPRGGRITIATSHASEDRICIQISDTGIGIDAENLPKIFDAFEQGDVRHSRQFGGLGLGLAITQALVLLHDGRISAHSDGPGKGSTFTLELPSARGGFPAAAEPARTSTTVLKTVILLVEDHADSAAVLKALLTQRGYTVILASTVAEALAFADHSHFDLLVSDIGLPDATGYQLVASLKKNHHFRGIAMSGYGMEEDICKSLEAGFDKHLVKPVSIAALEDAIQSLTS